jgi:hypothetical protein
LEENNKPVKKERSERPNQINYEKRVEELALLMSSGATRQTAFDYAKKKWGISANTTKDYLTDSYKYIKEHFTVSKEELINHHLQLYYDIYNNSKDTDKKAAIAALQAIERLNRIHAPETAIQNNIININPKDLTDSQLNDLLKPIQDANLNDGKGIND